MTKQDLYKLLDVFTSDDGYYGVRCGDKTAFVSGKQNIANWILNAPKPKIRIELNSYASSNAPKPRGIDWVPITIVSTDSAQSEAIANSIYGFLRDNGFSKPVILRIGIGITLYYRSRLEISRISLLKQFRSVIAALFTEPGSIICPASEALLAELDIELDPEEVLLLPDVEIVRAPSAAQDNKLYLFQRICEITPDVEIPCADNNFRGTEHFDAMAFFVNHGIVAEKVVDTPCKRWKLERCPFSDDAHQHEAYLLQFPNGAWQFVCLHPVHRDFDFQDFRLAYDRKAYSTAMLAAHAAKVRYNAMRPYKSTPQRQVSSGPWTKLSSVKIDVMNIGDYIASGFPALDNLLIGFKRGHVSVWCGKKGCGKSSLLNQIILNGAQRGFRTAVWSGELSEKEMKIWLTLQAAGKAFVNKSFYDKKYYVLPDVIEQIDPWFDAYISLYSHNSNPSIVSIVEYIRELYGRWQFDVLMLDNLMALSISELGEDSEWNNQKMLLYHLTKLAEELNIHVHLAAHPAKGQEWLNDDSIAGSNAIGNYAQNIFLVSRIDRANFAVQARNSMPAAKIKEVLDSECSTIIQIPKCRDSGSAMGEMVKLFYEAGTGRFKSTPTEIINYNWRELSDKPLPDLPFKILPQREY